MTRHTWLQLDLRQLEENVHWWQHLINPDHASKPTLCAVVKANGYGMGAVKLARCVMQAGAKMLAVFSPEQADELAQENLGIPILIFMPLQELELSPALQTLALKGQLHLTLHDPDHAKSLNLVGLDLGIKLPIHLQLDTGMSRAGLSDAQLARLLKELPNLPYLKIAGISTHMATADGDADFALTQLQRFHATLARHAQHWPADLCRHVAASYATLRGREFHLDMVRVGLGLHGFGPEQMVSSPQKFADVSQATQTPSLRPTLAWIARIAHVARYHKDAGVGYGQTHRLTRDSTLGIVPVGYADGYPLSLSNAGAVVEIAEKTSLFHAPVIGRINMDQIIIDLTDIPAPLAHEGTIVKLISNDLPSPCSLPRLAKLANSSCYEMLCRLSSRLPRVDMR